MGRRVHGRKAAIASGAVPQRKAVMMSGYHNCISSAQIQRRFRPFIRRKVLRLKLPCQRSVFFLRNFLVEVCPFASSKQRIQPPVNKHADFCVPPPFQIILREFQSRYAHTSQTFEVNAALEHGIQLRPCHFSRQLRGHTFIASLLFMLRVIRGCLHFTLHQVICQCHSRDNLSYQRNIS